MYPYSAEGVARCLKETCNTESPVVPATIDFMGYSGELLDKYEGEYHFETEDGKKYRMIVDGEADQVPYKSKIWWREITKIEERT